MIEALLLILAGCIGLVVLFGSIDDEGPPRKRVRTVIRSEHDHRVIGDGAWVTHPPSSRPRSARVRDIEPRGC